MKATAKACVDGLALVTVAPATFTCWLESSLSADAEGVFTFWAQLFAMVPGPFGIPIRRAFYRTVLDACASSFYVGFGALFTHRFAVVEDGVYIGPYALVGCARLRRGCLIGSRVSVLSGTTLHRYDVATAEWSASDLSGRQQIDIGASAWIGEGAIIMADVGSGSMVTAGAVVSAPVAAGIVVGGNPARFVRRLAPAPAPAVVGADR